MLRFLTAGESHGQGLVVILEGLPAGLVLDFDAIPILKHRSGIARDFAERLFALMILGDDRTVAATYVLGERAF